MNATEALVQVDEVTRTFPLDHSAVTALDQVSLPVAAGEFLAIAGPSGSGKSTLLNLIGCIDRPTSGRILIDGVDTTQLSPARVTALRREKIGFVFQTFNLIPVFTAAENVEYPLLVQGLSASERRTRVAEALESVGLSARAQQRPDLLSGGERQRVAVARAIVGRPALVLADEPTANLDHATAFTVINLMKKMRDQMKTTFVFSTHDQKIVGEAEVIYSLEDGELVGKRTQGGKNNG